MVFKDAVESIKLVKSWDCPHHLGEWVILVWTLPRFFDSNDVGWFCNWGTNTIWGCKSFNFGWVVASAHVDKAMISKCKHLSQWTHCKAGKIIPNAGWKHWDLKQWWHSNMQYSSTWQICEYIGPYHLVWGPWLLWDKPELIVSLAKQSDGRWNDRTFMNTFESLPIHCEKSCPSGNSLRPGYAGTAETLTMWLGRSLHSPPFSYRNPIGILGIIGIQ